MGLQRKNRIKSKKEMLCRVFLFGISMISVILFGGMVFWLLKNGISVWSLNFVLSKTSVIKGNTGLWEYLVNTICLLLFTLLLAGGMGIMAAVYLCEYVENQKTIPYIHFAIEILTGIPSIVFGLFGMVFFGEVLGLGYSLISGILTLTIMILPIMIENTKEVLQTVPKEYKMGALALGAGKWYMIRTILLPEACSGIATGLTLSAGKILGESAALLFTAGSKGSLAIAIYMLLGKGRFKEAYGAALLLVFLMLFLNLFLQYMREKQKNGKRGG